MKDYEIIFSDNVSANTFLKVDNQRDQKLVRVALYNHSLNCQTSLTYNEAKKLARFLMKELGIHEYEGNE